MKKHSYILIITAIIFPLLFYGCGKNEDFYVEQSEESPEPAEAAAESDLTEEVKKDEEPADIYVQVCGAVKNPGVYSLKSGSRIFEAVEMAGGLTKEADLTAINQAQVLEDGQMVYVYTQGEPEVPEGSPSMAEPADDGKVNINTAPAEQLMTLPGIGRSKAESIISWREEHGNFQQIEDIMKITGIKEGVFAKIKDHIKIN